MITTIIICITVIILAIIGLVAYRFYLKDLEDNRLSLMPENEPKDNRVYLDRLQLLQRRYEQVNMSCDLDEEEMPIEVRKLLYLIDTITNRLY